MPGSSARSDSACRFALLPRVDYCRRGVNAVVHIARVLPVEAIRRLAVVRVSRFDTPAGAGSKQLDNAEAMARVLARWGGDLCGLLNAMTRGELVAAGLELTTHRPDIAQLRSPELRVALWQAGARLERGDSEIPANLQPRPILLGGHLVIQAAPRGAFPPSAAWPRPLPGSTAAQPPSEEPETLDELLAAADRLIGVRLGRRGRDKGAWGSRAQALLGVCERGEAEPDWRGDVEIKTVPVAREESGAWRVVEDPAIAMAGELGGSGGSAALAKLQRTLWLARADVGDGDATIVSWYLLDWDPEVARLARRYLHERPKGPAGTDARGLYLAKRFFADAGLLATLNGAA